MNKFIDISVPLSPDTPHWPGTPPVRFERRLDLDKDDIATDTNVFFNVHCGTHVDAPSHFISKGLTVDTLPLNTLIGKVFVAKVQDHILQIDGETLEALMIPDMTVRLLLHTGNSRFWSKQIKTFQSDFAALTADGAEWIARRGIRLIGIDYLSIQRYTDPPLTHQILLASKIIILEGLNLSEVNPGWYKLFCLPMKFQGLEGAPVRAILGETE
jgi:arylformamidase